MNIPGYGTILMQPKMIHSANSFVVDETLAEDELLCEICCDLIGPEAAKGKEMHSTCNDQYDQQLSCGHNFCYKCWKGYLREKVKFVNKTEFINFVLYLFETE